MNYIHQIKDIVVKHESQSAGYQSKPTLAVNTALRKALKEIALIATTGNGVLYRESFKINKPTPTPTPTPDPQPHPTPNPTNPLQGKELYVDYGAQIYNFINQATGDDKLQLEKIAKRPSGIWIGSWPPFQGNVEGAVRDIVTKANAQNQVPVFTAYNILFRDYSGQHSAGGIDTPEKYIEWIKQIAQGLSGCKGAVVLLEPDAIPDVKSLPFDKQEQRYYLLKTAVTELKKIPNVSVYIDAGHPGWISDVGEISARLIQAGVKTADGFALNTSNFRLTSECITYGNAISQMVGKHYVIDTSRNGNGPLGNEWANPRGRAMGEFPTTSTGYALCDAFLHSKKVGESDGRENGGPDAGQFWLEYALEIARNTK